jgi:hypothetical protein
LEPILRRAYQLKESKIKVIKRRAYGFKNGEKFSAASHESETIETGINGLRRKSPLQEKFI